MEKQNVEESWRRFQSNFLIREKKKEKRQKLFRWSLVLSCLFLVVVGAFFFKPFWTFDLNDDSTDQPLENKIVTDTTLPEKKQIDTAQLNRLVSRTHFFRTDKNLFFIDTPKETYQVTTSIDIDLQEYILSLLSRARGLNRGKPQRIAVVAMNAATGKILAMSGFDLDDPEVNPCTVSDFPAASIFKIITASAAVEELGYTPHTTLYFNGNKYTLYKRQLRDVKNKYTYKITFSRAFAESVNPIFGKIGKNYLGKTRLEKYAESFGFNQKIETDLIFESGRFSTNGSEYHLAELGCGFNNNTTISPVFGAMMVSAVINAGRITMPRLVEHITDTSGEIIYKSKKAAYKKAISPETAQVMIELMKRTVSRGTAHKTFRGLSRDRILKHLVIGGKTGSLYNREHTVKYDWFIGFGKDKKTDRNIVLSIVVGHRKYIGTRAAAYAKMILKQYFKNPAATTAEL